ncbi:MAG: prephenate dehydrogenase/arogenate dehydrogenase family protein, partial [Lachnospiraceae bacterium]|nr:prephenate dehydrogenase/arogenate dehydrogenase family protein [Lachnospiraceae bacterium]
MTVGIVGLGLIGGSFAKAYSDNDEHRVLAYNRSKQVIEAAYAEKAIEGELDERNIKECDLILLCLYPKLCVDYLTKMAPYISKNTMVIDCCGTKEYLCEDCYAIAKKYGFTFVGGHPMAGRHFSGYAYSTKTMYNGA